MQCSYGGTFLVAASLVLLALTIWVLVKNPGASAEVACCKGHFHHGVASGDPHASGIVLWTRLTPKNASYAEPLKVHWQIWLETEGAEAFLADPIVKGESFARPERDFSVKIDVNSSHLKPRVQYRFQFSAGSEVSAMGHFRLPPAAGEPLESLKYAVVSCSNWRAGYFNAYAAAAKHSLDFWLHLGDFIYESPADGYPTNPVQERVDSLQPKHETVSLDGYRTRYALYRTDPDLQQLSSSAPIISIWDDHEVANDNFKTGAENHSPGKEGSYSERMAAATRAYHEWMPTRTQADPWTDAAIKTGKGAPWMWWRRLDFGNLASLMLLETRLSARTETDPSKISFSSVSNRITALLKSAGNPPPDQWGGSKLEKDLKALGSEIETEMNRDDKSILGEKQLAWLAKQVQETSKNDISWRLIAQPMVVQDLHTANYEEAIAKSRATGSNAQADEWSHFLSNISTASDGATRHAAMLDLAAGRYKINLDGDSWMAYSAERERFLAALDTGAPSATLVYGGDSHNAWAGTLRDKPGKIVAVEFDGMSVSSPGLEYYKPLYPAKLEAAAWEASNKDLAWADTHNRGFMIVTLTKDSHHVEYRGIETKSPSRSESTCLSAFKVSKGAGPTRVECGDAGNATSFVQARRAPRPSLARLRQHPSSLSVSH